jgi:hypothetical protein
MVVILLVMVLMVVVDVTEKGNKVVVVANTVPYHNTVFEVAVMKKMVP